MMTTRIMIQLLLVIISFILMIDHTTVTANISTKRNTATTIKHDYRQQQQSSLFIVSNYNNNPFMRIKNTYQHQLQKQQQQQQQQQQQKQQLSQYSSSRNIRCFMSTHNSRHNIQSQQQQQKQQQQVVVPQQVPQHQHQHQHQQQAQHRQQQQVKYHGMAFTLISSWIQSYMILPMSITFISFILLPIQIQFLNMNNNNDNNLDNMNDHNNHDYQSLLLASSNNNNKMTSSSSSLSIVRTRSSNSNTIKKRIIQNKIIKKIKKNSFILPPMLFPSNSYAYAATIPASTAISATTTTTVTAISTATNSITSTANINTNNAEEKIGIIDEIWTLIDKYYLYRNNIQVDWNMIRKQYMNDIQSKKINNDDDVFIIVKSMISILNDKYSRFLTPKQYNDIQKYDLIGIGVSFMPDPTPTPNQPQSLLDSKDNNKKNAPPIIVGSPPIPGSSADKANLQQGDIVLAIDGISTFGKNAFDIINQITSEQPNAPTITLTILKRNNIEQQQQNKPFDVTMTRTFQEIKDPIKYRYVENNNKKYGYIQIIEFNSLVQRQFEKALYDLETNYNINDGYIIDLRQNTGGAFQSALEIANILIPESDRVLTYVVDNANNKIPFRTASLPLKTPSSSALVSSTETTTDSSSTITITTTNDNINNIPMKLSHNIPIIVWIDSRTASSSEVLASALQDNCRALLVGNTKTYGKGLIQAVYGLQNYHAGLVLTVAKYMTPSGNDIHQIGLKPDIILSSLPTLVSSTSSSMSSSTSTSPLVLASFLDNNNQWNDDDASTFVSSSSSSISSSIIDNNDENLSSSSSSLITVPLFDATTRFTNILSSSINPEQYILSKINFDQVKDQLSYCKIPDEL